MAEAPGTAIWTGRARYVAMVALIGFVALLPMDHRPATWAPPDLMLVLTLVWVVRRPDHAPLWLIAPVFVLADLVFHRPPGLMAGLVVLVTEMLRARANGLRALPFMLEWATVSLALVALAFGQRLALLIVMLPQPPLGLTMSELVLSVLIYPVVVFVAWLGLGLRRPAAGEIDALGHRL